MSEFQPLDQHDEYTQTLLEFGLSGFGELFMSEEEMAAALQATKKVRRDKMRRSLVH